MIRNGIPGGRRLAPLLCLLVTACCTSRGPAGTADRLLAADPSSPIVRRAYAKALRAARHPKRHKISNELVALVPENPELIWNEREQVLMATWTRAKYYQDPKLHVPGRSFPLAVDSWFTAAPFVQRFCRGLELDEAQRVTRLEQHIGLPPGGGRDAFVEVWIDPDDLFRPCPDPEVTDRVCHVEVGSPHRQGRVKKRHRLPRACDPERRRPADEPLDSPHLQWMCANWRDSFENDELFDNYPWTALGYTYDWGRGAHGASEFVAPKGTEVVFHSLTPTAEYCAPGA